MLNVSWNGRVKYQIRLVIALMFITWIGDLIIVVSLEVMVVIENVSCAVLVPSRVLCVESVIVAVSWNGNVKSQILWKNVEMSIASDNDLHSDCSLVV